jgi:hypothetical protein
MNLLNPFRNRAGLWLALIVIALTGVLSGCKSNSSSSSSQYSQQAANGSQSVDPNDPDSPPVMNGVVSTDDNLYVVFDGSGSMDDCVDSQGNVNNVHGCQKKIDGAKAAVRSVINSLPNDGVNIGLYVFDSNDRSERIPLGPVKNNRGQFLDAVNRIDAGSGTPLGPAITQGALALKRQYGKQLGYGTFRLIVVTDGMPDEMSDVRDALNSMHKSGAATTIYTIGYGMNDPNHPLRKASLTFTAANTGEQVKNALQAAVSEADSFEPSSFQNNK